jgi:hypothetical protein
MSRNQHDRAHVRHQAERYRLRREKRLHDERPGYSSYFLDVDALRDQFAGYSVQRRRLVRERAFARLDHIASARLEYLLATHPVLAHSRVPITRQLVRVLGKGVMRELEPYTFHMVVGLDQRLAYDRLDVEPEWSKPDIVGRHRRARRHAWQRDEGVLCGDCMEEEQVPGAVRFRPGLQNYERWGGGRVKS